MSDNLDELIRNTESAITQHKTEAKKQQTKNRRSLSLPRVSTAFAIWILAVLLAIFEFEDVVSIVFSPADSRIETDLTSILTNAGKSLRDYQHNNGSLPPILPNPSIRGLVKYERRTEFSFVLTATVADVTLVLESDKAHPYRVPQE